MKENEILISSNISPLELSELNQEDAKQMDIALGVLINELPSRIIAIKALLDEVKGKLDSLKTRDINLGVSEELDGLAKNYDTFRDEVANYAGFFEVKMISAINIFDRQNSLDGNLTIDNNFFKHLPFLGTLTFTLLSYFGNGNKVDDFPQLALDVFGKVQDRDFDSTIGNFIYNAGECFGNALGFQTLGANSFAASLLIMFESFYEINYVNTDPRQYDISLIHASGDGVKLMAGNLLVKYAAIPMAEGTASWVTAGLGGAGLAAKIGAAAGGVVGIAVVVVGGTVISLVVDPIVAELTGEAYIDMTEIPKNGGLSNLYSSYVKNVEDNSHSIGCLGRTTSLYGMTVSSEYFHEYLQNDPVDTMLGTDEMWYYPESYQAKVLEQYIEDLRSLPKDSENLEQEVNMLTANAIVGDGSAMGTEYIRDLIYELGFDPYEYVLNN